MRYQQTILFWVVAFLCTRTSGHKNPFECPEDDSNTKNCRRRLQESSHEDAVAGAIVIYGCSQEFTDEVFSFSSIYNAGVDAKRILQNACQHAYIALPFPNATLLWCDIGECQRSRPLGRLMNPSAQTKVVLNYDNVRRMQTGKLSHDQRKDAIQTSLKNVIENRIAWPVGFEWPSHINGKSQITCAGFVMAMLIRMKLIQELNYDLCTINDLVDLRLYGGEQDVTSNLCTRPYRPSRRMTELSDAWEDEPIWIAVESLPPYASYPSNVNQAVSSWLNHVPSKHQVATMRSHFVECETLIGAYGADATKYCTNTNHARDLGLSCITLQHFVNGLKQCQYNYDNLQDDMNVTCIIYGTSTCPDRSNVIYRDRINNHDLMVNEPIPSSQDVDSDVPVVWITMILAIVTLCVLIGILIMMAFGHVGYIVTTGNS